MYKGWMWKQRSYREQFQGDDTGGSTGGSAVDTQQDDVSQVADEVQQQPADGAPASEQQPSNEGDNQGSGEESIVITLGDDAPPAANEDEIEGKPAPQWVKDLRKQNREKDKRIRELEQAQQAQQAQQQVAQPQAIDVGPEPKLEDFDYDGAAYRDALLSWNDRKRKADEQQAVARAEQEAAAAAWNQKVTAYKSAAAALKVDDFDHAESIVTGLLDRTQQGILLHGPNSVDVVAKLTYALGNNEAEAKKLAAIKDPIKFAFATADLIGKIKVQSRKQPPAPERQVRTTTGGAVAVDNTLERLRAEADRTGDRTKVTAYLRNRGKAAA